MKCTSANYSLLPEELTLFSKPRGVTTRVLCQNGEQGGSEGGRDRGEEKKRERRKFDVMGWRGGQMERRRKREGHRLNMK